MASTSEVGHNKNVANFKSLYQILDEMGTMYNPSNPTIILKALEPIKLMLDDVITVFNEKNPLYKNAVALRETNMKPLSKLTTRIANSFRACGASVPDIENADSLARIIRGPGHSKRINPETDSTENISTSRMSYDSRTANFQALIGFLEAQPLYAPNEEEIKVSTLKQLNLQQKEQNGIVNQTANELLTARTHRNNALYGEYDGVVKLVPLIKNYIKSLGEQGKPYYKIAVRLKFSNVS